VLPEWPDSELEFHVPPSAAVSSSPQFVPSGASPESSDEHVKLPPPSSPLRRRFLPALADAVACPVAVQVFSASFAQPSMRANSISKLVGGQLNSCSYTQFHRRQQRKRLSPIRKKTNILYIPTHVSMNN
jgi:hypothetical protein